MEGDSVFEPKELQCFIFNQAKPLLVEAGDLKKILISPIPRYLKESCCRNPEHVPNLKEDSYSTNLEDAVLASRRNLNDFAFRQGIRNIRVLGTTVWEDDPAMYCMIRSGFDWLAELVVTCAMEADRIEAGGSNRQLKTSNPS